MFIPDPGSGFLSFPDPDPGYRSRIRIRNIGFCKKRETKQQITIHPFPNKRYTESVIPVKRVGGVDAENLRRKRLKRKDHV
jgi:hypothetical protein